jgi:hypothetical protein
MIPSTMPMVALPPPSPGVLILVAILIAPAVTPHVLNADGIWEFHQIPPIAGVQGPHFALKLLTMLRPAASGDELAYGRGNLIARPGL